MSRPRCHLNPNAGFTLIELLTVMGIIAILSTVALLSYINMRSGGAYLALSKNLQNQVMLARQQAALENREVCLLFAENPEGEEGNNHEAVLVFQGGHVTKAWSPVEGFSIEDTFANVPMLFKGLADESADVILYNYQSGKRHTATVMRVKEDAPGVETIYNRVITPRNYYRNTIRYVVKKSSETEFPVGSAYGFVLHQTYRLPQNFSFQGVTLSNPKIVRFKPDGSITGDKNFNILETIRRQSIPVKISDKGVVTVDYTLGGG